MAYLNKKYCETKVFPEDPELAHLIALAGMDAADVQTYLHAHRDSRALYHFSPMRRNLFAWVPFDDRGTLLEISADCGALTGLFCDRLKRVVALEEDVRQCEIIARRYQDCDNLEIIVGSFPEVPLRETFDYIVVHGMVDAAPLFIDSQTPYVDFLLQLKRRLKPGGRMFLVSENRLGLKYLNGASEPHSKWFFDGINGYPGGGVARSFSKGEWLQLLKRAKIDAFRFYYPVPNGVFPEVIYTDDSLGLFDNHYRDWNFDPVRFSCFDEKKVGKSLNDEGVLDRFMNTFCIEVSKGGVDALSDGVIYAKMALSRRPSFQTMTRFYKDSTGQMCIWKSPLVPDAKSHLKRMLDYRQEMPMTLGYHNVDVRVQKDSLVFPFISGETVEKQLITRLKNKDKSGFEQVLRSFAGKLRRYANVGVDYDTPAFREVFGEVRAKVALPCMDEPNIDLIFSNIFDTDGRKTIIDYEWVMPFNVPVDFILWRCVHDLFANHHTVQSVYGTEKALSDLMGIPVSELEVFQVWNDHFVQSYVEDDLFSFYAYPKIDVIERLSDYLIDRDWKHALQKQQDGIQRQKFTDIKNAKKMMKRILYAFDTWQYDDQHQRLVIEGWGLDYKWHQALEIACPKNSDARIERIRRKDVGIKYDVSPKEATGFVITIPCKNAPPTQVVIRLSNKIGDFSKEILLTKKSFKSNSGVRRLFRKAKQRVNGMRFRYSMYPDYEKWIMEKENPHFSQMTAENVPNDIKISIVVPVYNVGVKYLKAFVESVQAQTYSNWELCIADDCSTNADIRPVLTRYAAADSRIKVVFREKNGHISLATNSAIDKSTGDFIAFMDNDDLIVPNALLAMAEVIRDYADADLIYSDEDKIDENGMRLQPYFKPDWSPDSLMSGNYICHFTCVRRTLLETVGGLTKGLEGAQDFDFILRCSEKARGIYHIPQILYHWRMTATSTAEDPGAKNYAYVAGVKSIENALARRNAKGSVVLSKAMGIYLVDYAVIGTPLVSVILSSKGEVGLATRCLAALTSKAGYDHYKVILPDYAGCVCHEEYLHLKTQYGNRIQIVSLSGKADHAEWIRLALNQVKGDYCLFVNDEVLPASDGFLRRMLGYAQQPHIGAVGPKMFDPDGTIRSAGVVFGVNGFIDWSHRGCMGADKGYNGRLVSAFDVSALSGACMMVAKKKVLAVGGLSNPVFDHVYGDLDLCLALKNAGYYNVVMGQLEAFNYDPVSDFDGFGFIAADEGPFDEEKAALKERWPNEFSQDPNYSPNLSREGECFEIG